ncbi:MAG: hypothetical protein EXR72_26440 [Myxococcales bacterium]|nr:hypothetical protein [Myxococcales bacterium]
MRASWIAVLLIAGCGEDAAPLDGGDDQAAALPRDAATAKDSAADSLTADGSRPTDASLLDADGRPDAADASAIVDGAKATDGPLAKDGALATDGAQKDGALVDAGGSDAKPVKSCFMGLGGNGPVPDYDQFHPTLGTHCEGTNHQAIQGVQKVVFLGDSVTVGTPPYLPSQYYRTLLGNAVAKKYNLNALLDVSSCAAWGARTDDLLLPPNEQIKKCLKAGEKKKTLVVMTVGGNDFNNIVKKGQGGTPLKPLLMQADEMINYLRDAIKYLQDPKVFPGGVYIVFANVYEFTDGTGDALSCPSAALAGYMNVPWPDGPKVFIYLDEQMVKLAVETKTDIVFMEELFCGHGFRRDDKAAPCYRGPGQDLWYDPLTCIHPNDKGHKALASFFLDVINE